MLSFRKSCLYKIEAYNSLLRFTIILFNCALACPKVCLLYDSLNDILVDPIKIHHWAHPKYTMLSSLYYLPAHWYALKFASNMILKMIYMSIREKFTTDLTQKHDDQLLIKEMPPQVMCTLNSKCFLLQAQSRHY